MPSNPYVYQIGCSQVAVGASLRLQVTPPAGVIQTRVGWASGGTLALVQSASAVAGTLASAGYILGTTETVDVPGPATFFMTAGGTTSVARVMWQYSAGFSLFP